jgi:hypothetical protein
MAFNIDFIADVSKFIKGTDNVGEALEAISDDLTDVAKTSDKALDSVGKDLEGVTKDAQDMDKKTEQAFKNMGENARETGKDTGRYIKDGTDKGKDGFNDLKEESASTAKEAAASFSSIEDAASSLQEIAANAFVGFGSAGMAAGLVAAAGIGLAISALTDNADKINENKEKMMDLAQTIKDNGGALGEADYIQQMEDYGYAIQDTKEWFEIFQADAISGFEKLKKITQDTSISTEDLFKGMFGDKDEAVATLEEVQKQLTTLREKKDAVMNLTGSMLDTVDADALKSLEEAEKGIKDNITAQEGAIAAERTRKDAIKGTTQALKEDIEAIEKHTDAVKGSISSELSYLDSVDDLNAKLTENGAQLDKNTSTGRENIRAVLDQASAIEEMAKDSLAAGESTDSVTAKFQQQKDLLVTQLMPAFGGSRDAAQQYVDTVLKVPGNVKTDVLLNDLDARNKLDDLTKARTAPLYINPDGDAVEKWFLTQQGRKIFVEFAPRGGGQAIAP